MRSDSTSPADAHDTAPEPMGLAQLLRATSRTFTLGIELLSEPLREEIRVAYLVLRVSDYLEDNRVMGPETKIGLLRRWHAVLHGEEAPQSLARDLEGRGDPIPDLEAVRHMSEIHDGLSALAPAAKDIIAKHAGDSTLGMARWVERGPRFDDEGDLDDYMHEVAGRVGYLLTDLFAVRSAAVRKRHGEMMPLAREFGLALQTVNVIRGLNSDRDRGWIFVPRSFIPEGLEPSDLFAPENHDAAMEALARLVVKAERHFEAARAYVLALPRNHVRIRLFCLLPMFFGIRTLAISRRNPDVLDAEVKITRQNVRSIARNTMALGWSNAWIRWYAGRLYGRA